MIDKLKNMEAMQLVMILIAFFHLCMMTHSWMNLGGLINSAYPVTWTPVIISVYTILFICTLTLNKKFYYAYISLAIVQGLSPTYYGTREILELFFPFYFLFAGILILDLKRAIYAHYRRSDRK